MAKKKYLEDSEVIAFFKAVSKSRYPKRDKCLFHLMLSYGLRELEAVSLQVDDLDLNPNDPQICIRRVKMKKKKDGSKRKNERWYDLSRDNLRLINTWLRERQHYRWARSDYLFITQKSRGKYDRMGIDCLYGMVKKLGKEIGMPELHPHMFRHTCGVRLARAGLNAFTIQRRLGHSNVVSSQLYVDLAGPDRKAEDERCENAIGY